MEEGPADSVKAMLFYDIPFSLIADTIVLPYTITQQIKHGNIWDKVDSDETQSAKSQPE